MGQMLLFVPKYDIIISNTIALSMDSFCKICYFTEKKAEKNMEKQDIRVQKTKKSIQEALFALLSEKPINKITIKELADKANINRKTFYAHYTGIEDIVNELEDELIINLREFLQQCMIDEYGLTPYLFMLFIDKLYSSNTSFFENMVSVRNYNFIAEKIKRVFKEQVLLSINAPEDEKLVTEMKIDYLLGGTTAVYAEWIRNGKPCSLDTMTTLLLECSYNGIVGEL